MKPFNLFSAECIHFFVLTILLLLSTTQATAQSISPISQEEFENYARLLNLDEDQYSVALAFFEDYQFTFETELLPKLRDLTSRGQSIYEHEEHPGTPTVEDVKRFEPESKAMYLAIESLEFKFFEDLESVLGLEQIECIQRVRCSRLRVRWRPGRGELPEGNVDPIALVNSIWLDEGVRAKVEEYLNTYEPEYTEILVNAGKARQRGEIFWIESEEVRRKVEKAEDPRERDRLNDKYYKVAKRAGDASINQGLSLRDNARKGMKNLLEILPKKEAEQLQWLYLQKAYPEIYPDPLSTYRMFDAAEKLDDLSEDQANSIEQVRSQYEFYHQRLSVEMSESIMVRRVVSRRNNRDVGRGIGEQWDIIRDLGIQREELSDKQIKVLQAILTKEQFDKLPAWDFEKINRERPWDPWWKPGRGGIEERKKFRDERIRKRMEKIEEEMRRRAEGGGG